MKRRLLSLFLVLSLALSLVLIPASADDGAPQPKQASTVQAVYLGVQDYGTVTSSEKSTFTHLFSVNGSVQGYQVSDAGDYALQNLLAEGYVYDITVEDGTVTQVQAAQAAAQGEITAADENSITVDGKQISLEGASIYRITSQAGGSQVDSAEKSLLTVGETVKVYGDANPTIYLTFVAQDYQAPIDGQPGVRTLKNFLATALEPAGTALYVYGGSWDWQDVGSSAQSTTIGIPQTWIDFFQSQDANYTYKNSDDPAHSYYPHNAWNQYYFAGVDCSAYVAWVTYNVMNTQSGNDGYVMSSTKMAQTFAQTYNFGTWTQEFSSAQDFKPGDIFSMNGHVWICLGVCEDGSMVILHSTPSDSKAGQPGGGIQLSGVGESEDCQAVALAQTYMSRYYPQWSARYDAAFKSYEDYTSFTGSSAGKFSWNLESSGLEDPDGYTNMSADEILADLFDEELPPETHQVVYLGIENFAASDGDNKDSFTYRFSVNGTEKIYSIAKDESYSIQNQLQEGYVYDIAVKDDTVVQAQAAKEAVQGEITAADEASITVDGKTISLQGASIYRINAQAGGAQVTKAQAAELAVGETVKVYGDSNPTIYLAFVAEEYTAPVYGTPGKLTLKNLLATAMEPVGTSLYIYGGAWDWQDVGSSVQATTIGLPQSWVDFFQYHDANYTYKNSEDPAHSYYWRGYNEYYFGGPDCSGYVGWVVYNLMNTESGNDGYVMSASKMAGSFADEGWGQLLSDGVKDFQPGDIFSMSGHVWMCLGTCEDGSVVFLHSTPSDSKTGQPGGGVQLSALDPDGNVDCQAYQLVSHYMSTYYPQWSQRYDAVLRDYESYTTVSGSQFRWDLSGVISDPDGYANMTADEILADLFGGSQEQSVVYLGVQDYGTVTSKDKSNFTHLFSVNGAVQGYRVDDADNYALQNLLAEGYVYDIAVKNDTVVQAQASTAAAQGEITSADENSITVDGKQISLEGVSIYRITSQAGGSEVARAQASDLAVGETVKVYGDTTPTIYLTFVAQDYQAPIDGQPGVRTLKNFLATALEPAGTALYVYGGSWDWQDVGSSAQSTTIGIPQTWIDFFQSQDANYTYKNSDDPAHSYYPHNAWNQYYFAGVDCSAYVAWVTYNVMNTQSGNDGYVMSSTKMAQTFAQTYNFGTWTQEFSSAQDFKPGDIFSMNGHVWICLGVCEDGSMVILHSTPSDSKAGQPGGGIQLSGVGESENCQAVALAQTYMTRYFPQWSQRYDAAFKSYDSYTSFTGDKAGKFSWNLDDSGLEDPDGYTNMSAAEILADLFGENQSSGGSGTAGSSSGASIQTSGQGSVEMNPTSPKQGDVVTLKPVPRTGYRLDSLTVLDRSGKEVPVTKQSDGSFTYTQPAGRVTVKAVFVEASAADIFDDVAADAWYAQAVDYVLDRGLMAGTSANTFSPEMSTSRGMLVTILYSLAGKPQTDAVSFSDVDGDAWYAQAVAWAASKNIVAGYGNGTFGPNDPLTREQTAAILYRFAQVQGLNPKDDGTLSGFSDQNQVQEWALSAMEWAVSSGLISGTDLGTLIPQAGATRAQMAVILMNFCQQMDK